MSAADGTEPEAMVPISVATKRIKLKNFLFMLLPHFYVVVYGADVAVRVVRGINNLVNAIKFGFERTRRSYVRYNALRVDYEYIVRRSRFGGNFRFGHGYGVADLCRCGCVCRQFYFYNAYLGAVDGCGFVRFLGSVREVVNYSVCARLFDYERSRKQHIVLKFAPVCRFNVVTVGIGYGNAQRGNGRNNVGRHCLSDVYSVAYHCVCQITSDNRNLRSYNVAAGKTYRLVVYFGNAYARFARYAVHNEFGIQFAGSKTFKRSAVNRFVYFDGKVGRVIVESMRFVAPDKVGFGSVEIERGRSRSYLVVKISECYAVGVLP